ncbi:hypothetical protein BD769DRAFT_1396589 [Suillus cothurnatus]|nr:hypothetical protein BD769DRAFT_1396589 [Suillus cothurnatus]
MSNMTGIGPRTPGSPSRKRARQCIHVGSSITLNFQLSSACALGSSDAENPQMGADCKQFSQNIQSFHKGTQTTVENGQSISEVESELREVKEQLKNAESITAHLSDRVMTYRYRWLEEYYCARNLERYMPHDISVPDLQQIAFGAPSPSICSELLKWDETGEGSEQAEHSDGEHLL